MLKSSRITAIVFSSISIALALTIFSVSAVVGQQAPFSEVKEKLSVISEEEKEILQNLFILAQEIEIAELEEKKLANEIDLINKEIKALEDAIAEGGLAYEKKRESLKQVLKSYQRMGPGSFLEIILDSDSLSTFLHRVNILRDLTKNTGTLLEQLELSGKKLLEDKSELTGKLALVNDKQKLAREAYEDKLMLKTEKEEYLTSLKGEKRSITENIYPNWKVFGMSLSLCFQRPQKNSPA